MIEIYDNVIQMAAMGACAAIAFRRAAFSHARVWMLLGLAAIVFFLSDVYWQLYYVFYGVTVRISRIPELCWYGGYLFFLMLITEVRGKRGKAPRSPMLWGVPVFTTGMCVFFLQWGDWFGNIVCAILMSLLIWNSIDSLILLRNKTEKSRKQKYFYFSVLAFCTAEYMVWVASCFWEGNDFFNPYYWADCLLSLTFLVFPFTLRKAVAE